MQSVTTTNLQNQTIPIQKERSGQEQKPLKAAAAPQKGNTSSLPEDIVNLSASTPAPQSPTNSKKPSIVVSNEEKDALLKTSSGKISFSTYA